MRNILILGVIIMNIKTVINVMKVVSLAVTIVPPVVGGAKVLITEVPKAIKNGLDNSEHIQEIKKNFELRREGVQTVKYTEV
jgi:hypothetical protein